MYRLCAAFAFLLVLVPQSQAADPKPLEFSLTFDQSALDTPFTGRVFVMFRTSSASPPSGMNWFRPEPGLAKDVKDWKPGEPLTISGKDISYPKPLAELKSGKYHVSAVMDRDLGGIDFSASPGNVYSKAVQMDLDPASTGVVELKLDQVYKAREFKETDTVKLVDIESPMLTKFHGKPTRMRAGVVLPPSFAKEPERKYPVVYEITGFGGNHFVALGRGQRKAWDVAGVEMIWVVLDANCRLGHHVFADSANNGPVGTAFVEELIPHLEKTYRGNGIRFTTGHSSGGWSSLWLQVAYPDTFAGCWSTAPDPVDFRDFQKINVYEKGTNMFADADGNRRPIARTGGKASLFYQPFSDMEEYMGRGGQLGSFEAVFSPKGTDGRPRQLWDRKTGEIVLGDRGGVGEVRHPPGAGTELENARAEARRQDPRLHGRGRHLLSGRGDAPAEGIAYEPEERRGCGTLPQEEPRQPRRCRAPQANKRGDGRRGTQAREGGAAVAALRHRPLPFPLLPHRRPVTLRRFCRCTDSSQARSSWPQLPVSLLPRTRRPPPGNAKRTASS